MGCNASRATNVNDDETRQQPGRRRRGGLVGRRQLPVRRGRAYSNDYSLEFNNNYLYEPGRTRIPTEFTSLSRRSIGAHEETSSVLPIPIDLDYRTQRRRANLDLLRSEMLSLERVFQSLIEQAFDEVSTANHSTNENNQSDISNGLYPPASDDAIENLPTITISKHDFEDGCNKECSICFIEFNIGDSVSRIPCGHLYHDQCISEWLHKKCTCPICRWEIETDDALFEIERIQRMKLRRIRIKDHELDRLCIQGLQDMAGTTEVHNRAKLIQQIKSSDNIDVIVNENNNSDGKKNNSGKDEGNYKLQHEHEEGNKKKCHPVDC